MKLHPAQPDLAGRVLDQSCHLLFRLLWCMLTYLKERLIRAKCLIVQTRDFLIHMYDITESDVRALAQALNMLIILSPAEAIVSLWPACMLSRFLHAPLPRQQSAPERALNGKSGSCIHLGHQGHWGASLYTLLKAGKNVTNLGGRKDDCLWMQAINVMSHVDFDITQVVDSNVGIHARIPK